jgi:hypothetical protein
MLSLVVYFILSIILLWLLVMYNAWRKSTETQQEPVLDAVEILNPVYKKSIRFFRHVWFFILRILKKIRSWIEKIATKIFFAIFPNARKAFEKKDELTGLEHGPSSYFLMSVSGYKDEFKKSIKKIRRNGKNV